MQRWYLKNKRKRPTKSANIKYCLTQLSQRPDIYLERLWHWNQVQQLSQPASRPSAEAVLWDWCTPGTTASLAWNPLRRTPGCAIQAQRCLKADSREQDLKLQQHSTHLLLGEAEQADYIIYICAERWLTSPRLILQLFMEKQEKGQANLWANQNKISKETPNHNL